VLDLEETETCEQLEPLVERAALVGDKRALPRLEELQNREGCGKVEKEDCFPCLRDDQALETAIETINQRVTLVDGQGPARDETTEGK
jgi:hypothetical protein